MLFDRRIQASWRGLLSPVLWTGVAAVLLLAGTSGAGDKKSSLTPQQPVPPAPEPAFVVHDTPVNLQAAFSSEINARERYATFAKQADAEGHPEAARVFRACAKAEDAHAHLHTVAIAYTWTGDPARAVLTRYTVGSTADNLRAAIETEKAEVANFYPALLERARTDNQSMAVRSITLALSAEREHVALLTKTLENLDQHAGLVPVYVCPYCGKTVESVDFNKCSSCFTSASKFIKVT
jgi:rubrerythrin